MKYFYYLACCCLLLPGMRANGQDLHLSQYYAAPLYLNPALTGMVNGSFRVSLNHKNQWASITNPYTTYVAAFDAPVKRVGLGFGASSQTAGDGGYRDLNLVGSFSYDVPLGSGRSHIVFGVQGGIIQKSFDASKLTFDDQYDPSTGFSPDNPTGESFPQTSVLMPEVNAGLLYFYGSAISRVNPFVGISSFHLTSPDKTFMGGSYILPMRYVAHGGLRIKCTRLFEITPHALGMQQATAQEIAAGISAQYYLSQSDAYLILGSTYRLEDAVIAYTGIQIKDFTVGLSYDVNVSSLDRVTSHKGGYELSVSYTKRKKIAEPKFICPRL